jgi:8-oxoguanine deaminase
MVAGEWRVIDGWPLGVDVPALREAHGRMARDRFSGG